MTKYLKSHSFALFSLVNYVDYENVEPGVGPVERIVRAIESRKLEDSTRLIHFYSFVEHQI